MVVEFLRFVIIFKFKTYALAKSFNYLPDEVDGVTIDPDKWELISKVNMHWKSEHSVDYCFRLAQIKVR